MSAEKAHRKQVFINYIYIYIYMYKYTHATQSTKISQKPDEYKTHM